MSITLAVKERLKKIGIRPSSYGVEFNSIKRGGNATVDSDVALVSHLINSEIIKSDKSVNGKCFKRRVFNMAILNDEGLSKN